MSDYITLDEFKVSSELVGFTFADYDARIAIAAASRGIDEYCGRTFGTATTTDRYYSPLDSCSLDVNDLTSVGTFQIDADGDGTFETTWTENVQFILAPLNAAADGKPYEEIQVRRNSYAYLPCFERSVKITGAFGWPATPDPVKQATTIITTRLLKRAREAPFGIITITGTESSAVHVARTDPDTAFLLDPFVRGQGVMVA